MFKKVGSSESHSLHRLLPLYHTSDLHLCDHSFRLPEYYTDLHKNRSLFDLCMNILSTISVGLLVFGSIIIFYSPFCALLFFMCVSVFYFCICISCLYLILYLYFRAMYIIVPQFLMCVCRI